MSEVSAKIADVSKDQIDAWLKEDGPAALTYKQRLKSVTDDGSDEEVIIFPPSYAGSDSESSGRKQESVYPLSKIGEKWTCIIDNEGSQANRIEPVFKVGRYAKLVPQVEIKVGERTINLLDAGHRAGDAVIRFSTLKERITKAFTGVLKGDFSEMARTAPTTIVFGAWDSHGSEATQSKLPRIVSSEIRAYDVHELSRSTTYFPAANYADLGVLPGGMAEKEKGEKRADSQLGLTEAPSTGVRGGIAVSKRGAIIRSAYLRLTAIRALSAWKDGKIDDQGTRKLRRYILGLALTALSKPMSYDLRTGCFLVSDGPGIWRAVYANGASETFKIEHETAFSYAEAAASDFRIPEPTIKGSFQKSCIEEEKRQKDEEKRKKKEQREQRKTGVRVRAKEAHSSESTDGSATE